MNYKLFISHASEDKEEIARPLSAILQAEGFDVWYDEFELRAGDSLIKSIDNGLYICDYAIVILSPSFFSKQWTQRELLGLATRELNSTDKIILPIWHNVTLDEIIRFSPPLADKFALNSSIGLEALVKSIKSAVRPPTISNARNLADRSIINIKGHYRYTIKDSSGAFATAKRTTWFYTTADDKLQLRDPGMIGTGELENIKSNLGEVDFRKEGASFTAYTNLKEPLKPFKIYEHSLEYTPLGCFTESHESVATNVTGGFENIGNHVFFPKERRPKKIYGALFYNSVKTNIEPTISKDSIYVSLIVDNPPDGSRILLEWDW